MSRDYREKRVVVWPAYIDATLSRKMGRRVPRSVAVPNPTVEEIVEAASQLGLNPVIEDSPYPRAWWKYRQRVVVDKTGPKQQVLRKIAEKIKEIRREKR